MSEELTVKIVEEPIPSLSRTSGESKLHVATARFHDLRSLLLRRSPALIAICILLLGITLRMAFVFPAREFVGDSDSVVSGLCALEVMDGHYPAFFPGGVRTGPLSCYLPAGMFYLLGPTRAALSTTSVLYGALFLIFGWLALRELAGPRAALPALLLLAVPPIQFMLVNYPVWGYEQNIMSCALTLWLGFRLLKPEVASRWKACLLFGLSLAFAFWMSPQTLMITLPLCLMLLWKRSVSFRRWLVIAAGALPAITPYGVVIYRHGLAPFRDSFATKPVTTLPQLISNAHYLFGYSLPVLFFGGTAKDITTRTDLTFPLVLVGYLGLIALAIFGTANHRRQRSSQLPVLFPLLILLVGFVMYIASGAGSVRGWTVRYVDPLYLTIPLTAALLLSRLRSASARAVTAVCAIELAIMFALFYPPYLNHRARKAQIAAYAQSRATIAWMKQNHIDVALGDYWTVYFLNFDSLRSVIALPITPENDYMYYGEQIKGREVRVALLDSSDAHLEEWAKRLNEPGKIEHIGNVSAYVLQGPIDSATLQRARVTNN